ncbi:MAG: RNA polymerase factor sigma-54 [Oscillospiraceae bacterium]|nr:RNA polymerase factor sigma-54 [Oscillospiraceae bacterium]
MELKNTLKQTQTLTPQQLQSIEILQMNGQELAEYLENQTLENPVLEIVHREAGRDGTEETLRKLEWLSAADRQNSAYYREDYEAASESDRQQDPADPRQEDLADYLKRQLDVMKLRPAVRAAAVFLAESLDSRGWLIDEPGDLARSMGVSKDTAKTALKVLQGLEPAGVGARDLAECLRLRLDRLEDAKEASYRIVDECLEWMAKKRYDRIAQKLGLGREETAAACEQILRLNPKPGNGFASREALQFVTPDLFVLMQDGQLQVLLNERGSELRVNDGYIPHFSGIEDKELREYLAERVHRANWLIQNVQQRRTTLLACGRSIVGRQAAFFRTEAGQLVPMSLADVAADVGVHESTVSRCVKGKYLQCRRGVYPLSAFFSRALPQGTNAQAAFTADAAMALLRRLIEAEDPDRPLSDRELSERMAEEGCALSRRTVAKYRDLLGIPGTAARRRR